MLGTRKFTTKAELKKSEFILGLARTVRGMKTDMQVVVGLLNRQSRIKAYLTAHRVKKLQLGTSNNALEGWLNSDVVPNSASVIYLNATRRFPFPDNTFDYIMAEHMIEHVEYQAARVMLRECFRVLKRGGRVRFATPDLEVLLALHTDEKTKVQRDYIDWAIARFLPEVTECKDVFVINNFFRAWGHRFLYDKATLHHALHTSGFRAIRFYKPGDSEDPTLRNLESHGKEITEDINQFETMVVEGDK